MNFTTNWSIAGASSIYSYNKVQEIFYIHNFEDIYTPVGKILAINPCGGNEYKSEVTLWYKILN